MGRIGKPEDDALMMVCAERGTGESKAEVRTGGGGVDIVKHIPITRLISRLVRERDQSITERKKRTEARIRLRSAVMLRKRESGLLLMGRVGRKRTGVTLEEREKTALDLPI